MCIIPHSSYHWITLLGLLKVLSSSPCPSLESFGLLQVCQIFEVHLIAIELGYLILLPLSNGIKYVILLSRRLLWLFSLQVDTLVGS